MSKKIELDLVKYLILESATEDLTGLYEVIWELNSKFPDVDKGEKILVARIAIQNLLDEGHLNLFKKFWTEENEELVDQKNWTEIINQDKYWEPPDEDGLYYCFFETSTTNDELWKQFGRNNNASQQKI